MINKVLFFNQFIEALRSVDDVVQQGKLLARKLLLLDYILKPTNEEKEGRFLFPNPVEEEEL